MSCQRLVLLVSLGLVVSGCTQEPVDTPASPPAGTGDANGAASGGDDSAPDTRANTSAGLKLTPQNTRIQFVGVHTDDRPDRVGVFTQFAGQAEVDREGNSLKSASVEIQVASLSTEFAKLTTHLKSEDFFDVNVHPTARFESTSVSSEEGSDQQVVTGNLTLMGTTKEVRFPAQVNVTDGGLTLEGQLTIDRTEFGMDKMLDGVKKDVRITVTIGKEAGALSPAAASE